MNVYCHLKKKLNDRLTLIRFDFVITQESLGSLDICAQSPNRLSVGVGKNWRRSGMHPRRPRGS